MPDVRALPAPASQLGEAPVWCPEREALSWVDIWRRRLYTWHETDGLVGVACLSELPGGLALTDGGLLVAHAGGIVVQDDDAGWRLLAHPGARGPGGRYNDVALDPRGRIWVGTVESAAGAADGSIYGIDTDGRCTTLLTGLAVPNGIDFSPDGASMYVTITERGEILRFGYDVETGTAGAPEIFATDVDCAPDGLVVDAEGTVWSAKWDGAAVMAYEPSGAIAARIDLPVRNVTSLTFGGLGLSTLYVTTAADEPDGRASQSPELAGRVLALTGLGATGQPVRRAPAGAAGRDQRVGSAPGGFSYDSIR